MFEAVLPLGNQITDRFWPSVFLLSPELQDEDSCRFRLVSRCCDLSCVPHR